MAAVAAGRLAREGCGRSGQACGGAEKNVRQTMGSTVHALLEMAAVAAGRLSRAGCGRSGMACGGLRQICGKDPSSKDSPDSGPR